MDETKGTHVDGHRPTVELNWDTAAPTADSATSAGSSHEGPNSVGTWRTEDWNLLFKAVNARLHDIATSAEMWRGESMEDIGSHPGAAAVLDCALALERLRAQVVGGFQNGTSLPMQQRSDPAPLAEPISQPSGDGAQTPRVSAPMHSSMTPPLIGSARTSTSADANANALAWMPGESFLRERISTEIQRLGAKSLGFSILHLEFPEQDIAQEYSVPLTSPRTRVQVPVGESLRVAIAARLRGALLRDDVIAQFARNEFVCLLLDADTTDGLGKRVYTVVSALSLPYAVAGERLLVRPQFGVARCPNDGTSAETLLHCARTQLNDMQTWRGIAVAGVNLEAT